MSAEAEAVTPAPVAEQHDEAPPPLPEQGEPMIEVRGLWSVFPVPGGGQHVVLDLVLTVYAARCGLVGGSVPTNDAAAPDALEPFRAGHGAGPAGARLSAGATTRGHAVSARRVLDNIAFPLRETRALPDELAREAALLKLQMVGLKASDAHKMPSELSGGMIKRVALARALIMDPPLLMLDEPTAGLDPDSSDAFVTLLRSLHQDLGLTVVMVTHDLDTLFELSTRVAVLADQHVVIAAPVPEVLAFDHPFIRHFFLGERGQRAMELLRQRRADPPAKGQ